MVGHLFEVAQEELADRVEASPSIHKEYTTKPWPRLNQGRPMGGHAEVDFGALQEIRPGGRDEQLAANLYGLETPVGQLRGPLHREPLAGLQVRPLRVLPLQKPPEPLRGALGGLQADRLPQHGVHAAQPADPVAGWRALGSGCKCRQIQDSAMASRNLLLVLAALAHLSLAEAPVGALQVWRNCGIVPSATKRWPWDGVDLGRRRRWAGNGNETALDDADDPTNPAEPTDTTTTTTTTTTIKIGENETEVNITTVEGSSRIAGGATTNKLTFPAFVAVQTITSPTVVGNCGGALITDQHVITAAHCVGELLPARVISTDLGPPPRSAPTFQVAKFCVSPIWMQQMRSNPKLHGLVIPHDFAILKLARRVALSPTLQPACLPERDWFRPHQARLWMCGLGQTDQGQARRLQFAEVSRVADCGNRYQACTYLSSPLGGSGEACPGDSGSPQFVVNNQRRLTVISVHSGGLNSCERTWKPTIIHQNTAFHLYNYIADGHFMKLFYRCR